MGLASAKKWLYDRWAELKKRGRKLWAFCHSNDPKAIHLTSLMLFAFVIIMLSMFGWRHFTRKHEKDILHKEQAMEQEYERLIAEAPQKKPGLKERLQFLFSR